jgi:hypothetical protein
MKTPTQSIRQSHLRSKKTTSTPNTNTSKPKLTSREKQQQTVSAGLAICLLGSYRPKMFDSEYEEEVRKQAVMQVSPSSLSPLSFIYIAARTTG